MSSRFILALAGIALLVPFFFLPDGIPGTVLLVLAILFNFGQVAYQLFKDARWVARWIGRKVRRDRFAARTTPDRSGP